MAKFVRQVGIKELKDQASSIIEEVQLRKRPITVTKNNRAVARIIPAQEGNPSLRLKSLDLVASFPRASWESLELEKLGLDSSEAIGAISEDRE